MIVMIFLRHSFSQQENKNVVIIQMKYCTHCERYYHVKNKCRNKHSYLKRNRNQSTRENQADRRNQSNRRDRHNKRRRRNRNDDDNNNQNDDDENVEKFHKLYIVVFFETISTMNVMLAQIIF